MSHAETKRTHRVGELLRQELGQLLVEGVRDPRVGFVTVTEVRPSPDLRSARVYVSVYGTPEQQASALEGLADASGYLQRELGRRVRLRYLPELTFVLDESLTHAARIEALIDAATDGEHETPAEASFEAAPVSTSRTDREAARLAALERRAGETRPPKTRKGRRARRP